VVTECRTEGETITGRQALLVRRGDCDPVTVREFSVPPVPDPLGLCGIYGRARIGEASVVVGAFQRLGVSPDRSAVVFELTTDHAVFPLQSLPPGEEGIYVVHSDGTGVRRLGPASRDPAFRVFPAPVEGGLGFLSYTSIAYSPDGRTIAFTDLGPGPAGEETVQIVTVDLATGRRMQVTRLPPASPPAPGFPVTGDPVFLDDQTIAFLSASTPDGLNPTGDLRRFRVKTDGTGLRAAPAPVVVPGSRVVPIFRVTGSRGSRSPLTLFLPGPPVNPSPFLQSIAEVFLLDGRNLLQLTNFHRVDTAATFLGVNAQRVFFRASADPLGSNPTQNCQLFSIDSLGADLRQLTHFRQGDHSALGCGAAAPPGCAILFTVQDPRTGTVVFMSSCDPLGTNPYGAQIFAMRPDGSNLRDLTRTRGVVTHRDGSVATELPGPWDYSTSFRTSLIR
jgi:hypothetical protein